jgi:hypothetical protein
MLISFAKEIYTEWCRLGCYATRRNIPEDTILHSRRPENLKSYRKYIDSFTACLICVALEDAKAHSI